MTGEREVTQRMEKRFDGVIESLSCFEIKAKRDLVEKARTETSALFRGGGDFPFNLLTKTTFCRCDSLKTGVSHHHNRELKSYLRS